MAQTILARIGQLMRANINALLDQAEDPERMLDQLLRDFSSNIEEAEQAVALTVGNLRLTEQDLQEARDAAREWGDKAAAAARKAAEVRAANAQDAARFENLAKIALRKQISFENQATTLQTQVDQQQELSEKLRDGLNKLRVRYDEVRGKRDELVSRAKMAEAQVRVQQAVRDVSVMNPTSELARFEDSIRRQEAMAKGMEEVGSSSIEEQFAALDDDAAEAEVETRLSQLLTTRP
jgi:phage shock protein A